MFQGKIYHYIKKTSTVLQLKSSSPLFIYPLYSSYVHFAPSFFLLGVSGVEMVGLWFYNGHFWNFRPRRQFDVSSRFDAAQNKRHLFQPAFSRDVYC